MLLSTTLVSLTCHPLAELELEFQTNKEGQLFCYSNEQYLFYYSSSGNFYWTRAPKPPAPNEAPPTDTPIPYLFFPLRKALPDRDASGAAPRVRVSRMRRCGSTRLPACRRNIFAGCAAVRVIPHIYAYASHEVLSIPPDYSAEVGSPLSIDKGFSEKPINK